MRFAPEHPIITAAACLLALAAAAPAFAQNYDEPPPPDQGYGQPAAPAGNGPIDQLPPLDQLLAPVALYPDPVLSLVLSASTTPNDIQAAASYLGSGNDPNAVEDQPWNPAVKDLAHYPDVVQWMASNLDWTQQLGGAFANQPGQVMDAVQDLRHRALSAGTLQSTPQVQVIQAGDIIEIVPTEANVIYVPRYDPDDVFFPGAPGPYFDWGPAYPAGVWLGFDFDWGAHRIWTGNWFDYERSHGGWRTPVHFGRDEVPDSHQWNASRYAGQVRQFNPQAAGNGRVALPNAMQGAPHASAWNQRRGGQPNRAQGQYHGAPGQYQDGQYQQTAQPPGQNRQYQGQNGEYEGRAAPQVQPAPRYERNQTGGAPQYPSGQSEQSRQYQPQYQKGYEQPRAAPNPQPGYEQRGYEQRQNFSHAEQFGQHGPEENARGQGQFFQRGEGPGQKENARGGTVVTRGKRSETPLKGKGPAPNKKDSSSGP